MRTRLRVYLVHTAALISILSFVNISGFAQGAKVRSQFAPVEDHDADHPIARDQWFLRGRAVPGQSAAALRFRAHQQKMQLRAARKAAAKAGNTLTSNLPSGFGWVPLGPSPLASDASGVGVQDYGWVSGRATALAIDPADGTGNTVYVGGAYGGLWRSQNAASGGYGNASGVTWTPLIDGQPTLAVGAIAIQPGNVSGALSNVILVGTGEANSSADSYYGLGILRSTNAGQTWSLISSANAGSLSFDGLAAARMAFNTASTNTVVAAMATSAVGALDGAINSSTQRGLYTSTNAGQSWAFNQLADPGGAVTPATSATSVVYNAAAGKFFAAVRYHGFYSSPDGLSWTRLAAQPGGSVLSTSACPPDYTSALSLCPIYRGEIAVVPGRNEMYAWYVSVDAFGDPVDQGIWKTTNGGSSWTSISDSGITSCGDVSGCGVQQGFYNLELLAVPNGDTATDLYAGAVNLFKCSLNNTLNPTCASSSFINLTHVYGCSDGGDLAHVHPDQHDLRFMMVNGKDIMYFANDGGIYRALDGFTGLTSGSCTQSNQFDSLNQTLGSMTQFVSFVQHPSDANTLLGGTQDNGSAATSQSQISSQWLNVNSGDGGYSAINPNNTSEWFTANTNVSIQRCTLGVNCHSGDFAEVVSNSTVGGDGGPFYTPYMLDPQSSGEMLVGTCRVWRGTSSGAGFSALSNNFDTGSSATCTGGESNLVRSLAAGGPKDSSGFSNVIYAGTDGIGAPPPGVPAGGHIWMTTNAAGGANAWVDRTQSINPDHLPVSSVAIDTSDATGQTAYVSIMGFHVSHAWKTTNAGQNWTDFTGDLPDAPANAVVVDPGANPSAGTVYVATDVGVFFTGTGSTSPTDWTELGPPPGSGLPGYLPNVAVTALRLFVSGGAKRLRASTYGRGIWEYALTPDFGISFDAPAKTIFPGQTATFNGDLVAAAGYNNSVAMSCTGSKLPSPCTLNPKSVQPTSGGTPFTLSAGGSLGDYSFNVHGVGSDTNKITHDYALSLHVVDFGIGAPSPSNVTANWPYPSPPITFQVTGLGSFSGAVTLTCSGLPAGASCGFSPGASVNPTSSAPVTMTLTIATVSNTPMGTYSITISASTSGAPASKTQSLTLNVTTLPDFTLNVNAPPATIAASDQVTVNGTITAFNGYNSAVNLSCAKGSTAAPGTCTPNPKSITPKTGGTSFSLTLGSSVAGAYSFNLQGTGTDSAKVTHGAPVSVTFYDFKFSNTSGAQTVKAGVAAKYNLSFSSLGTSTFVNSVTFSCSGLLTTMSCSFSPTKINAGSGPVNVTVTVNTTAPTTMIGYQGSSAPLLALCLPMSAVAVMFGGRAKLWRRRRCGLLAGIFALILTLTSCGGGAGGGPSNFNGTQPGTPAGTYNVTVTATSGSLTHTAILSLTVQ